MNGTRGNSRTSFWILGALLLVGLYIGGLVVAGQYLGGMTLVNLAVAVAGVSASTTALHWWRGSRTAVKPVRAQRVILVGAGSVAQHAARQAEELSYEVLGYVEDPEVMSGREAPRPLLGTRSDLPRLAHDLQADQIILADMPSRAWEVLDQLEQAEVPAELFVVPEGYELALARPTDLRLGDVPLFRMPRVHGSRFYRTSKRVIDVSVSVVLLVLFAPFLLLSMLAVRMQDRGPALFWQERVGKNGRRFHIVKLRTMVTDAERGGPQLCKGKADPRLTPVGSFLRKTHLDEVPQLWNVLRGEMSLVGPRPERPVFVDQFEQELPRYAERHRILPGITGLAQINGFYHSSPREKLRYDLMYMYHANLWMDFCIIVRTGLGVFR